MRIANTLTYSLVLTDENEWSVCCGVVLVPR